MLVIFLGAPGSGKGTISEGLVKNNGYKHISTGDIFRSVIKSGTELGNKVKDLIEGGNLVDDKTTWEVAKVALETEDLNNQNVILDGYPRNIEQAKQLNQYLNEIEFNNIKKVYYKVDDAIILKRLSGRMMCSICGKSYHKINFPPKVENKCDLDNGDLYQREDDKIENVKVRLETYKNVTEPLIKYYDDQKKLITINGEEEVSTIIKKTRKEIE